MENHPVGGEFSHAFRRMDGQRDRHRLS